jgi:hypothetical protein
MGPGYIRSESAYTERVNWVVRPTGNHPAHMEETNV